MYAPEETGDGLAKMVWKTGLHVCALGVVVLVLWRAAGFLRLAAIAVIVAAALETPVAALERRRWRRGVAIAVVSTAVAVALLGALALVATRVAPQVSDAVAAAPQGISRLQDTALYAWARDHEIVNRVASEARRSVGAAAEALLAAAVSMLSFAGATVTVVALAVFLLVSGPGVWGWLLQWLEPSSRGRVTHVARKARAAVAGYVAGALTVGAVAGIVTTITTGLLGVDYFLVLGLVTAVLGIVPFIGAIVSGVLVVAVTFFTVGTTAGLVATVVFVAYQQCEATLLQPLIQRHTISLNPLVVLFAALLGTAAAGVFGGVAALPITAAGKVVANDALARRRKRRRRAVAGRRPIENGATVPRAEDARH